MESLRAIDCLTRAARMCIDFGQRELESRVMVLKAQVQENMPRIPATCVSEFTIDLEVLQKKVDDLLKDGVKSACTKIVLAYLPDKEQAEEEVRHQGKATPLYSMTPLTMIDESNRDVATAGSIEGDFAGRTVRCMADGFPFRAAWLHQLFAEILKRHADLGDSIVSQAHVSPLFNPQHRAIVEKGVAHI